MTTTSPDGEATPDPGAIDLEPYKEFTTQTTSKLIAAVEALREKADNAWNEAWDLAHEPARCGHVRANYKDPKFGTPEYKGNEKCEACAEVEALRERVAGLEGEIEQAIKWQQFYMNKAEAAEARVVELAGAISAWLEHRHDVFCAQMQGTFDEMPTNRIDEIVQQCEDVRTGQSLLFP